MSKETKPSDGSWVIVIFIALMLPLIIWREELLILTAPDRDSLELKLTEYSERSFSEFSSCIDEARPTGLGFQTRGGAGIPFTYEDQLGHSRQAYLEFNRVRRTRIEFEGKNGGLEVRFYAPAEREMRTGEREHLQDCLG